MIRVVIVALSLLLAGCAAAVAVLGPPQWPVYSPKDGKPVETKPFEWRFADGALLRRLYFHQPQCARFSGERVLVEANDREAVTECFVAAGSTTSTFYPGFDLLTVAMAPGMYIGLRVDAEGKVVEAYNLLAHVSFNDSYTIPAAKFRELTGVDLTAIPSQQNELGYGSGLVCFGADGKLARFVQGPMARRYSAYAGEVARFVRSLTAPPVRVGDDLVKICVSFASYFPKREPTPKEGGSVVYPLRVQGQEQIVPEEEPPKSAGNAKFLVQPFLLSIDPAGNVKAINQKGSVGWPIWERKILETMPTWRYVPGSLHGAPTTLSQKMTFIFARY